MLGDLRSYIPAAALGQHAQALVKQSGKPSGGGKNANTAGTTKTLLPKNDNSLLSHHHMLPRKQVNEYVTFSPNPSQDLEMEARKTKMLHIESIDQLHNQSLSHIRASQDRGGFISPNSSMGW